MLGEGPTFGINGRFGSAEKKLSINFNKANTKFCLSLHYNGDNSYLFVNEKEIFKCKADNKNVNFPAQCCLRNISNSSWDRGQIGIKIGTKHVIYQKLASFK